MDTSRRGSRGGAKSGPATAKPARRRNPAGGGPPLRHSVAKALPAPLVKLPAPPVQGGDLAEPTDFPLDRLVNALIARGTAAISPISLYQAYADWAMHLALAPGKQAHLMRKALRKWTRFVHYAARCAAGHDGHLPCIEPLVQDRRFAEPEWREPPFNLIYQAFLLHQQWWYNATTGVRGVTRHHEQVMELSLIHI